jgi:ABC-type Fe3+/spermidine/putrescine transport system ATPase subunit
MRQEIRKIQKDLGITTLYVTHDQEEAMSISDHIAIFNHGEIEQVGTPSDIYFRPRNRFVAEFTGTSNLMDVEVIGYDAEASVVKGVFNGNQVLIRYPQKPGGKIVTILLRPEWIKIVGDEKEHSTNLFYGQVISSTFVGFMVKYQVKAFGDQVLAIEVQDPQEHEIKKEGDPLYFRFSPDRPVVITP